MPRDLETEKQTLEDMPTLSKEGDTNTPFPLDAFRRGRDDAQMPTRDALHPYVETLNLKHLDSCHELESQAFPPNEACSREKFIYRLTKCGELALGLFTSAQPDSDMYNTATASTGPLADSADPSRREILLAHIVSTKTSNSLVSDNDMALPPDWKNATIRSGVGHDEAGRTLALHSLAVLPSCHRRGLGSTILKAYIQRIESSEIADRIALLAHDALIPFYERHGFVNKGKSDASYGGGGWYNMILELKPEHSPPPSLPKSNLASVKPAVDGVLDG